MSWFGRVVGHYAHLLIFLAAVLAGMQVPALVQQLEQAAGHRLDEVQQALAPYRQDAQQFGDGNLTALIARYKRNADEVVRQGGYNIERLYQREQDLQALQQGLAGPLWQDLRFLALNPKQPLMDKVIRDFDAVVPLNQQALLTGLGLGLLIHWLMDIFAWLLRQLFGRRQAQQLV